MVSGNFFIVMRTLKEVFPQDVAISQSFAFDLIIFSHAIYFDLQFQWQKLAERIRILKMKNQDSINCKRA